MVCQEPTSTGTGMSRPRPLAASSAATAALSKASAPMPYTVSVGSTTSRPPLSALIAEAIPARAGRRRRSRRPQPSAPLLAQLLSLLLRIAVTNRGRPARSRRAITSVEHADRVEQIRRSAPTWCRRARRRRRPPGRSNRRRQLDDRGDDRHAVRAAEQRVRRIMLGHFGFQRRHRRGCRAGSRPSGRPAPSSSAEQTRVR